MCIYSCAGKYAQRDEDTLLAGQTERGGVCIIFFFFAANLCNILCVVDLYFTQHVRHHEDTLGAFFNQQTIKQAITANCVDVVY